MGQPTNYNTAIYLRLSRDDGTDFESSSIQTQREQLTRYCRENGFNTFSEYVDDGWSGMTSDRPSFQRLLADIENGAINCVITKDLSRLGRNYLEVGGFTELFFPEHNCRYIAVNDGVDTANGSTMDFTPFKNLVNDMYIQDISKKTRSAMLTKKRQGKFIGDTAPFGYEKDPADKNHLIINEKYAPIVRRIFQMAKDGLGVKRIADILTAEKILRPGAVAGENHAEFRKYVGKVDEHVWCGGTVRQILRNPTYKGCVVGNKSVKIAFRSKKRRPCSKDEIIIVEGMHEPIIDPEEWELVQEIITSRRKKDENANSYDNIFAGLIKCADCGGCMSIKRSHRRWNDDYNSNFDFYCNNYNRNGTQACTTHKINASALHNAVLEDIQRLAKLALKNDSKMISEIAAKLGKTEKENVKQIERELKKAQKRLDELDRLFAKLYEEHVNDEIDERNYKRLSASYIEEQKALEARIEELNGIIKTNRQTSENAVDFVEMISGYADITELTQATLRTLIERIDVHEPEEIDGEYIQKLDIYYKFIGNID